MQEGNVLAVGVGVTDGHGEHHPLKESTEIRPRIRRPLRQHASDLPERRAAVRFVFAPPAGRVRVDANGLAGVLLMDPLTATIG
jgi:hypothetical protein